MCSTTATQLCLLKMPSYVSNPLFSNYVICTYDRWLYYNLETRKLNQYLGEIALMYDEIT